MERKIMSTIAPQEKLLPPVAQIRRVRGQKGDPYELIFLDQHDRIIVPLTEWYRLRIEQGPPASTRNTYLACLLPWFTFLAVDGCAWNAPPEQLRKALLAYHRDCLGCKIHPQRDSDSVKIDLTSKTPLRESTLKVMRAALRDFYLIMRDAGLYAFANPLTSEVLVALKREQERTLANKGAPDHAGVRGETHEQSRRRPTAFLRQHQAQEWTPDVRKELADVREGIHTVIHTMLDSAEVSVREKAVLHLLQSTGARLHEVALMTVGGYQNEGIAGQAQVMNKGSYGREVKTIYFFHNPHVQEALNEYLEQVRPLHDTQKWARLADVDPKAPLFLTARGTPYSPKAFYYHWYRHYVSLQSACPVPFSPHDLRHLFVTENLIRLKLKCGFGTDHFDAETYLSEREAFGRQIMSWRSAKTINIYDQSRRGESVFSTLAEYQKDLSQRSSAVQFFQEMNPPREQVVSSAISQPAVPPASQEAPIIWALDAETLDWVKNMERQAKQQ
jgi:site-specific recombinase XerD